MKKLNVVLRLKRPRIGVAGKHVRLTHAVPIGLLLLPVIWFIVSPHHIFADLMSSPGLTVTVTEPNGVGDKFKEETDFATVVLGDPWDMNQSTDIKVNGPVDNPGRGFGGASFASGVFSGTTISNDAYFWLLHQGYPQANNVDPHSGLVNPIDASKYTRLTFRLYRDDGNTNVPVRVYWYKAGDEVTGQPSGTSVGLTPYAGWHVYSLDLSNPANASTGSWSGQITGIRIDPTSTSDATFSGKLVQLDWARLTDPTSGTTYNVTWTSNLSSGSALASVFLDDDNNFNNGTLATIGASILVTNTTGAYAWKPQGMPPGNYYVHVSMGTDYAGVVRGDPWDFNQSTDYVATYNLSNVVTAGGIFSGTSTSNDPQIWMNVDATNPISTSLFHTLVISINVSSRVDFMVLWTRQGDPGPWQGQSRFVSIDPGWRAVSIELSNPSNIALGSWSGSATDFRVDPGTVSGVTYQIAWVGVTSGVTPTLESDLSPAVGTSTGPLTVNQAPIATFIAPSMTSGDDYATTVLAAPWNPGLSSTFVRTDELTNTIYAGNILTATSVSGLHVGCGVGDCGDPELWLNVSPDPSRFIDAARFKYITLKYWNEIEQDVFGGSVLRFLWTPTIFPNDISTIDDVVVRDGWPSYTAADGYHTYQFNLQNLLMEPEGGVCTVANCWGWNDSHGRISQLRFDPIEVPYGSTFHVQQILLTADPVASGSYTISWSLQNTDDTATVSAYYYTNPLSKTLIGSAQQPTSTLVWNTTPLPSATYTVELQVNDGYNTTIWPSRVPVIVRPPPVITLTKPTGSDQVTRAREFSENVLGNTWDMSSSADIDASQIPQITPPVFANGVMSFTTTGTDPSFWLSWDNARPIDASLYKTFCFRMYSSQASQWQVFWYDQAEVAYSSNLSLTLPGWNTYSVDLSTYPNWTGSLKRLRLDPVFTAGIQLQVDWVKLVDPTNSFYTATWTTANGSGARVSFFYTQTNTTYNGTLLKPDIDAAAGSQVLDLSCLDLGSYYLYASIDNGVNAVGYAFSPGPLTVTLPPTPVVTLAKPSGSDQVVRGGEFSQDVLRNAWDMSSSADIDAGQIPQITPPVFANGVMSFTTTGTDPSFWLSWDNAKPIDASKYKNLCFRLYSSQASLWQVYWYDQLEVPHSSNFTTTVAGWDTYQLDMTTYPNWTGSLKRLRLDPVTVSGAQVQVDWVKLTDPASAPYTVTWTSANVAGAKVSLYYTQTNTAFNGTLLKSNIDATAGSQVVDLSCLDLGSYYLYAAVDNGINPVAYSFSPGALSVTLPPAPAITLTKPIGTDRLLRGGEFSQDVYGNAWDMSSSADIDASQIPQITPPVFANGVMSFTTTGTDPSFWLSWDNAKPIDASKYKNLCFRMYSSQASQWQVFWYDQSEFPYGSNFTTVVAGWNTYQLDLSTYSNWTGSLKRLRLDPVTVSGAQIQVDWIKLTDPASALYTTTWTTANPLSATVSLSYTQSTADNNGTLVRAGLNPTAGSAALDLSCVDAGTYYLLASIDNGINPAAYSFSPGPLLLASQITPTLDVTTPSITMMVQAGAAPLTTSLVLNNSGATAYSWTVASSLGFVAPSPGAGSAEPAAISIVVSPTAQAVGTYSGNITINAPGVGTRTVPIVIYVVNQVYSTFIPSVRR